MVHARLVRVGCELGGQGGRPQGFLSTAAPSTRLSLDNIKVFHRISGSEQLIRPVALATVFLLADFFMAQRADVARGREIIERWCVLAEQRLEHLTELFESGRWRRYHSERSFLENIQQAKTAVETWRSLASREALPDNSAVDLSWLNSPRPLPPRRNPLSGYYVPPPSPRRAEPAPQISERVLKLAMPEQ